MDDIVTTFKIIVDNKYQQTIDLTAYPSKSVNRWKKRGYATVLLKHLEISKGRYGLGGYGVTRIIKIVVDYDSTNGLSLSRYTVKTQEEWSACCSTSVLEPIPKQTFTSLKDAEKMFNKIFDQLFDESEMLRIEQHRKHFCC